MRAGSQRRRTGVELSINRRRRWTARGRRFEFEVRGHTRGVVSVWWHFRRWVRDGMLWGRWHTPVAVSIKTNPRSQAECYCPTGSLSILRVQAFDSWFAVELSRDWTPRPCYCDKVLMAWFPENHAEEIEEYGVERLVADFPEQAGEIRAATA